MPERIRHPDGTMLGLVAKRNTTPEPANAPKPIYVQREFIEVAIFDSIIRSRTSHFGHAAIEIDGIIYSRAPTRYYKGSYREYLRRNTAEFIYTADGGREDGRYRDVVGYVLWVSPREKHLLKAELERRVRESARYSLLGNSCSSNVADVLEMIAITARDPRGLPLPSTPKELMAMLKKSNRLVEHRLYKKGSEGGASDNW